jgi:hypothetical protein
MFIKGIQDGRSWRRPPRRRLVHIFIKGNQRARADHCGIGLNCICESWPVGPSRIRPLGCSGETSGGLTAQAAYCASQRAAQCPIQMRVKCLDDGVWNISPSLIQQAFADEHVDFPFA